MEVAKLTDVTRIYKIGEVETRALNGVSLAVESGEFTSLVGPSGSGKTTLLQLIGCLDQPTSGKVVIAEMPVSPGWIGRRMSDIEVATNGRLAYLTRLGDGMIPGPDTVYQEGDLLHIALLRDDLAIAERVLDAAPPAH